MVDEKMPIHWCFYLVLNLNECSPSVTMNNEFPFFGEEFYGTFHILLLVALNLP
jgi:hypothetical protein